MPVTVEELLIQYTMPEEQGSGAERGDQRADLQHHHEEAVERPGQQPDGDRRRDAGPERDPVLTFRTLSVMADRDMVEAMDMSYSPAVNGIRDPAAMMSRTAWEPRMFW